MVSRPRQWSRASRRLVALFLVVLVPPAVALAWLGFRVLEQDGRLAGERVREQRELGAKLVVRSLADALEAARLAAAGGAVPNEAVALRLTEAGLTAEPVLGLAWTPTPVLLDEAEALRFAGAEADELAGRGDRGQQAYERDARNPDARVRAGALVRLARVLRRSGHIDAALARYAALATIRTVAFDGMPVDLVARRATCALLHDAGRSVALASCAADLARDLLGGRWSLGYGDWQRTVEVIEKWTAQSVSVESDRPAVSAAASWLWSEIRSSEGRVLPASGHHALATDGGGVTLLWTRSSEDLRAVVIPGALVARWVISAAATAGVPADAIRLATDAGVHVAGPSIVAGESDSAISRADETGLPWDTTLTAATDPAAAADEAARRWTFGAGLAAILVLVSGGAVLIWRVVARELAVARLQTDFVAAVSHEFRTPLTALQHAADLLDEHDDLPADRRRLLYGVVGRSTTRLSGLVESLLDFARMEDGRKPYVLRELDLNAFVTRVVDEFTGELDRPDVSVTTSLPDHRLRVQADEAALTRAVWNLLENAVKYSPRPCTVRVSVERSSEGATIAVVDDGPGIPRHEQREIFQKFARGADAVRLGITGTGLGLAMVAHIVEAHQGTVGVESEPGKGARFTIALPVGGTCQES